MRASEGECAPCSMQIISPGHIHTCHRDRFVPVPHACISSLPLSSLFIHMLFSIGLVLPMGRVIGSGRTRRRQGAV